jgi:outer membrane lipoprotein-sorting protein
MASKYIVSAISIAVVIAGFMQKTTAVTPQSSPSTSVLVTQSKPTSTANPTQKLDLPLLIKTGETFFKGNNYQTVSQMQLKGINQGTDITFYIQTKTIVNAANQFRSEIAFTQDGKPSKESAIVVSDGKQVYIHRPDLKQYSVISSQAFNKSNDSFLIGLSSSFFLEFADNMGKYIASGALSQPSVINEISAAANQAIQGEARNVEGKQLYVYSFNDPKQGYTLSAFVNPQLANLEQMQIVGKDGGLDIAIIEKIQQRTEVKMAPQTFRFTPPPGAKKVNSLSISPF